MKNEYLNSFDMIWMAEFTFLLLLFLFFLHVVSAFLLSLCRFLEVLL